MAASRDIAYKKKRNAKESRLLIVAELFRMGKSYRQIQEEVIKRLQLTKGYSLYTVHTDVQSLLKEWREQRIEDFDFAVQAELEKISWAEGELVEAWLKSKEDYQKKIRKQKGRAGTGVGKDGSLENKAIKTTELESVDQQIISFGDPRYMAELTKLREQRIKLMGLNAPEKHKVQTEETVNYDVSNLPEELKKEILKLARSSEQQG